MSDTPITDLLESEDMSELYRLLSGKCARRTNMCGKCGAEYNDEILESMHFCRCGHPLYCTLEPANLDLGDIGYDVKTQSLGGPCFRHMNEKQYRDFQERHRGISMPMFTGRLGEIQRSMMDDRKYGSVKENAVLANVRLMELGQRLDQQEGSSVAWFKLGELWEELQEIVKTLKTMGEPATEREIKKKLRLQQEQVKVLGLIGSTIKSGASREQTWADILNVNDLVAKYKLQETDRRQKIGAMMTPEEIMEVVSMIVLAVESAITESVDRLKATGAFTSAVDISEVNDSIITEVKKHARLSFHDPEKLPIEKGD